MVIDKRATSRDFLRVFISYIKKKKDYQRPISALNLSYKTLYPSAPTKTSHATIIYTKRFHLYIIIVRNYSTRCERQKIVYQTLDRKHIAPRVHIDNDGSPLKNNNAYTQTLQTADCIKVNASIFSPSPSTLAQRGCAAPRAAQENDLARQ